MIHHLLIVDDHEPWRRRIRAVLGNHPGWVIVAEAVDGLEAIWKAEALRPDVIVLDISLPDVSGILVARQILAVAPQSKILFFSENRSRVVLKTALATGARGYLLKSNGHSLLAALEAVGQGKPFISEGLTDEGES